VIHPSSGLSQSELAERLGKSRPAVANTIRLLALSDDIRSSLARGEISEGHARALVGLPGPEQRRMVWRRIVQKGLSVRQTEELVRALLGEGRTRRRRTVRRDPDVARWKSVCGLL
jgi:ParB family chromosome partitioning protein